MAFQDLVTAARKYFPSLCVEYKDRSKLMKVLATLLFFNKGFLTDYTTTIGNTIYIPTHNYVRMRPVSGAVVFLHDVVHLYDQKKMGALWFQFLYMFPQILFFPFMALFFVLSWKIVLPLVLLSLLPIPAYFRMRLERRAYLSSIYVIFQLSQRMNFKPHLDLQCKYFAKYFGDYSYYFMWPFKKMVMDDFNRAVEAIQAGKRPYEDPVFDMLDDLVTKV